MSQKKIIGRREIVSILDLELIDLDAKIDTGADSNSLHCDDIYIDDEKFVHFKLLDKIHPAYHGKMSFVGIRIGVWTLEGNLYPVLRRKHW